MRSFAVSFCAFALVAAPVLAAPFNPRAAFADLKDCNHKPMADKSRHRGDRFQAGGYHSDGGDIHDDSFDYYDYSSNGGRGNSYNGRGAYNDGRFGSDDTYESGKHDHVSSGDAYNYENWHGGKHKESDDEAWHGGKHMDGDYDSGTYEYTGGGGDHRKDKADDSWRVEGGFYEGGYGTVPNSEAKNPGSPKAPPPSPPPQQQSLPPPPPPAPKSNPGPQKADDASLTNAAGNVGTAIKNTKSLVDTNAITGALHPFIGVV